MNFKKIRIITITISILFHILLLCSYKSMSLIRLFPAIANEKLETEQEKEIVFELVETPEHAKRERPNEQTNLVSDKNSIARDQYQKKDKQVGNPYSVGNFDVKNVETPKPIAETDQKEQFATADKNDKKNIQQNSEYAYEPYKQAEFSRQALIGEKSPPKIERKQNEPKYDNQEFNAEDIGGMSFNTYEWEFAPYMLHMKRKVQKNIFPPPAFTYMGMISGEATLRFKVMPNGEVKDLEVLGYKGHKSLMETSVNAIKSSTPFNPLPPDFPEDYLEVTAKFSYYINR